jgi:hypothetical protein
MKYYFITYQATNRRLFNVYQFGPPLSVTPTSTWPGSVSTWNQVIKGSPMAFIKHVESVEEKGSRTYYNFVVINTCEISEEEFSEFDGHF